MILPGDALEQLRTLPAESVQCCVTSPPYWGLRDYGIAGQLGLEPTPEEYVTRMVEVFEEVRRVLRPDGTAWVNLGDSYVGAPNGGHGKGTSGLTNGGAWQEAAPRPGAGQRIGHRSSFRRDRMPRQDAPHKSAPALKPKDLVGIPWRVAFALQAAGWYLRSDIIWHKPNPMPESVRDRPTKAHEYLFLLAKSERYIYDAEAIQEPCESGPSDIRKMTESRPRIGGKHKDLVDPLSKASSATNIGRKRSVGSTDGRNKRSVWTIATQPYPEAHFATFPEALVEPCIRAGTRPGDTVLDPFAGSGTTLAVAAHLGRKYVGIELNPEYVKLIRRRLERVTPPLFPEAV